MPSNIDMILIMLNLYAEGLDYEKLYGDWHEENQNLHILAEH